MVMAATDATEATAGAITNTGSLRGSDHAKYLIYRNFVLKKGPPKGLRFIF